MNADDLEQVYELLARKIDALGPARSELYLAKLTLLLAHDCDDIELVARRIDEAADALTQDSPCA